MSGKLAGEIGKQRPFESLEQEAALNLQKTADALVSEAAEVFKPFSLSVTQYNVLRILRGAGDALSCSEISRRMISKDPDMTRLLDRMEKRQLISRCREEKDRRVVLARITPAGLELLAKLDEPVVELHKRQLGHLGDQKLGQLIELLEAIRK